MSPEQARGKELDARSDLLCFGLVLYEMATGRQAFAGTTAELFDAILNRAPVPPVRLNPEVSPELERIINKSIEKDRRLRYQTASDLEADLKRLKRDTDSGRSATASSWGPAATASRKWVLAFAALVVVLALAGFGAYLYFHPTPKLTERDSILLTDFVNTTGESVFNGTLKQAMAVDLEQSPYLNVFPKQKVQQTLKLMERPADTRISAEIGREICQRNGIKAMLKGTISSLGSQYVITLQAVNSRTGDVLASEQSTAASKEQVLKALDSATSDLRAKLGESLASIQKFDKPLKAATTSSLDALKAFSLGEAKHFEGDEVGALPLLKRAVEIDPNFAFAHAMLAVVCFDLHKPQLGQASLQKAYDLRERVTEREKFYITAHYFDIGTGQLEKSIETYQLWTQTYPRDFTPFYNLMVQLAAVGQYDKALEAGLAAHRLEPMDELTYEGIAAAYLRMSRFEEAKAILDEAVVQNPDTWRIHLQLYQVALCQGDEAEMQRQAARSKGKRYEPRMLMWQGHTQAYFGKLRKAREFYQRGIELAQSNGDAIGAFSIRLWQALVEVHLGDFANARKHASQAVANRKPRMVALGAAIILAKTGDIAKAQELWDAAANQASPQDTLFNETLLAPVRALIEVQRANPDAAIEMLKSALPFELGSSANLFPAYVRGLAYLRAKQGQKAAQEFQKLLNNPGVAIRFPPPYALARLGVARGYALSGVKDKARQAYQDFLVLYKDADPDIPVLKQAKAEYASLQ